MVRVLVFHELSISRNMQSFKDAQIKNARFFWTSSVGFIFSKLPISQWVFFPKSQFFDFFEFSNYNLKNCFQPESLLGTGRQDVNAFFSSVFIASYNQIAYRKSAPLSPVLSRIENWVSLNANKCRKRNSAKNAS